MIQAAQARRISFFTFVGHTLTHVYIILFPPLLIPMQAAFGLTVKEMTFYITLLNIFFGLGAAPAGWLSSRLGDKALLVIFFFGCALGGAVTGLARGTGLLAAGVILLGLATSIYHPIGTALLSKGTRKRGLAMGINGIAGSLGVAIGPFFAAGVIGVHGGLGLSWRWAFLLLTPPSLVLGIWLWAADLGPAAAGGAHRRRASDPGGSQPGGRRSRLPPGQAAFYVLLLAAMTLGGFSAQLATTLLPSLLTKGALSGLDQVQQAALRSGVALAFAGMGQLAAGLLCDRLNERWLYVLTLVGATPLLFLLGHSEGTPLLAASCGAFFLLFALQPTENSMLAQYSPPSWRGIIYGLKFILVFGLGGLGSWSAGLIEERHGLSRVYEVAGATLLIATLAAVAACLLPAPAPKAQGIEALAAPPAVPPP